MRATILTISLALVLGAAGCKSTSADGGGEKPRLEGTPVPMTPEPDLSISGHQWADFFKGATCVLVPDCGDGVRDPEFQAFSAAFQEHFFGQDSPFQSVDADALAKAAERRSVLGGVPAGNALTMMANKEGVDFVVYYKLDMRVEPTSVPERRDIGAVIRATGTTKMSGSATKNTKEFTGTIGHDQLSISDQLDDYRARHAAVVGKLLAKKMLQTLTKASDIAVANFIHCTFKQFSDIEKRSISDALLDGGIPGINPDDVQEISADDSRDFTFKFRTAMNLNSFQRELEGLLEDEGYRFQTRRQSGAGGNSLQVIKGR